MKHLAALLFAPFLCAAVFVVGAVVIFIFPVWMSYLAACAVLGIDPPGWLLSLFDEY